ncbi:MAG TPA: DUF362 domain-containing protein [Terriglobia bacterium]|nr:DUF362 domain-containing protein [Terriglobia bacterium]
MEDERASRRDALVKLLRLGGLGAASAGAGVWLSGRSRRPEVSQGAPPGYKVRQGVPPDPNLPALVVARGDDPRQLVRRSIDELGGIRRFVAAGEVVVIKPNIGWDRTPEQAANTNPLVVAAVVRLCRDAGARRVIVTDVSCNDPRRCFPRSGIPDAALAEGAEVLMPEDRVLRRVNLGASLGSWLALEPALSADKLINLPVAKHHSLTGVTLGMKNWLGIVSGPRNRLHQDIHHSLVALAEVARPVLTIIDAYRILVRNGPTGGSLADVELKKTLIASTDPVAADAYAAKTYWDLDANKLLYLKIAQERGLGRMDFENVRARVIET